MYNILTNRVRPLKSTSDSSCDLASLVRPRACFHSIVNVVSRAPLFNVHIQKVNFVWTHAMVLHKTHSNTPLRSHQTNHIFLQNGSALKVCLWKCPNLCFYFIVLLITWSLYQIWQSNTSLRLIGKVCLCHLFMRAHENTSWCIQN